MPTDSREVTSETTETTRESRIASVVLLGPQTPDFLVGGVLQELGVKTKVALVTAGWQERETDDTAIVASLGALGFATVNLKLHARSQEVMRADPELAEAYSARQERLRQVQSLYSVRLDYVGEAARAISVRHVDPELLAQEELVSVEQFRQLDRDHLHRCRAIHTAFNEKMRVAERPAVQKQVRELRALIDPVEAIVIAGGHVASLLNRMKLFDVAGLAMEKHLVAWSAGAMVLTDRIILFHDFPPYGSVIAQVLDVGLCAAPGLVVLPDPRRRIRMEDRAGIARFAQRMAPATCVAMDRGSRVVFESRHVASAHGERLRADGRVDAGWSGAPA